MKEKQMRIEKGELFSILSNTINGANFDDLNEAVYKIYDVAGYRKQRDLYYFEEGKPPVLIETSDNKQSDGEDTNVPTTNWISVEERLPHWSEGKVLVLTKYGFSICERTVNGRWQGKHANWITHWMPLPDAPKGER